MNKQDKQRLLSQNKRDPNYQLQDDASDNTTENEYNPVEETFSTQNGVSVLQAYDMIGGFGKFHWIASILLILGFCSGQYVVNLLGYLTLAPVYECSTTQDFNSTVPCIPFSDSQKPNMTYFCETNLYKRTVLDAENSLRNWYESLDLACRSQAEIGLLGSNMFAGWTLAALVLPRQADIYGRRLVFMSAILLQTVCFAGLYFTSNLYVAYVLMFLFGGAAVGRCSISYLFLMELLPKSRQVITGTILSMNNQLTGLIGCLYFWQISKDWHWLELYACGSGILSMVGVYFLPESPKYLVSLKKYDQARQAINTIARINNRQEAFDSQFDREVEDQRENVGYTNPKEISDTSASGQSAPTTGINEEKQLDGSLKDLLKIRRHSINLILMVVLWVASSFGFFLVNYTIKKIPGDFFDNNFISALAAIPTTAMGGFLYDRLGVKRVFVTFFSIAALGGIALVIFSASQPNLVPIMVAFAKGGTQATLETCYLANSFMFPAIFAGTAFGLCNAGAKIATIVSPVLAEFTPPMPMIVFSIFSSIGAVLPIFLRTEAGK